MSLDEIKKKVKEMYPFIKPEILASSNKYDFFKWCYPEVKDYQELVVEKCFKDTSYYLDYNSSFAIDSIDGIYYAVNDAIYRGKKDAVEFFQETFRGAYYLDKECNNRECLIKKLNEYIQLINIDF